MGTAGGVNWDEPYYSDSSDGEESSSQGSHFLPREESPEQDATPPEPTAFESEGEDEYDEEESHILDSPFLDSFQREIHSIVRDYRQEVSETFQHLMEDIIYSRGDRLDPDETPTSRPVRRGGRRTPPPPSRGNAPREAGRAARKSTQINKPPPSVDLEEESDSEDDFVVGESDEENDEVLTKLNKPPRRAFATEEEDSDEEDDDFGLQRDERFTGSTLENDGGKGVAVPSDSSEDEEDELAARLMDDWDSSKKNSAWDGSASNIAWDNNAWDDNPVQEKFGNGTNVRGFKERPLDDEIQSSVSAVKKTRKKRRRKRRKNSAAFSTSGGDQSAAEPSSLDVAEPDEPGFVEVRDTSVPDSGGKCLSSQ